MAPHCLHCPFDEGHEPVDILPSSAPAQSDTHAAIHYAVQIFAILPASVARFEVATNLSASERIRRLTSAGIAKRSTLRRKKTRNKTMYNETKCFLSAQFQSFTIRGR